MQLQLKQSQILITLLCIELCITSKFSDACSDDFSEASKFFERENEVLRQRYRAEMLATYAYYTNVTEANRLNMIAVSESKGLEYKKLFDVIRNLAYDHHDDPCIQRQAKILTNSGYSTLNKDDYDALQKALRNMQNSYTSTKVCSYKNVSDSSLSLEPHIRERLSKSRDPKELAYYWQEWHDKAGTPMKENFVNYVELSRKAAKLNNYTSHAEYWMHFYEDPDFENYIDEIFETILPFYREIHAYVRYRLNQHYGEDIVHRKGNIPMHLLGNMWGQSWDEIIELVSPYPNISSVDIESEMKKQNWTVEKMFELGDKFFKSLGMRTLPDSFWNLSVLEKPKDRIIACGGGSAWNLYENADVRISMCTEVNSRYLYVVHHELGHIQYYLQFEVQPTVFRDAPIPAFHEAVGDVIVLSVSSLRHLNAFGLSAVAEMDNQSRIYELFKTALNKIVILPYAYTIDKYRHAIFRNEIDEAFWNRAFWRLRSKYSGVEPAVARSDNDFDPPTKYHINYDVDYWRYFVSNILLFQFHKAMCLKAGQYVKGDVHKTLDNCDIYGSKEAGEAFSRLLSAGASRHWSDLLYEFTGDKQINPSALLEYFEPLYKWLKEENRKLNIPIGWDITEKVPNSCPVTKST